MGLATLVARDAPTPAFMPEARNQSGRAALALALSACSRHYPIKSLSPLSNDVIIAFASMQESCLPKLTSLLTI